MMYNTTILFLHVNNSRPISTSLDLIWLVQKTHNNKNAKPKSQQIRHCVQTTHVI